MADGIIAAAVIPHVPRIGIEERAPEFAKGMIAGIKEAGESIRALKPDAIVLMSAHWVSTFAWYATGQSVHKGICVAEEAPDLIPGSPYEYKGKPELAEALAETFELDLPTTKARLETAAALLGQDRLIVVLGQPIHHLSGLSERHVPRDAGAEGV